MLENHDWLFTYQRNKLLLEQKVLKQAGAELCQAQVNLEVIVEVGVEVKACHF